jgi:WD40 domain-containing protein
VRTVSWVPRALCLTAAVAAAAERGDEKRKPCSSTSVPGARAVAISRDARYAAATDLESFHVLEGGLAPAGLVEFSLRPAHMAPHPDRALFAVAAGNVHLVDMATRKPVAELGPASWFVAWRRGGAELLGIDYDNGVHIWDAATRREIAKWRLPLGKTVTSRFADYADVAGLLALGFDDGSVRVFDMADGRQVSRFDAHPAEGRIEMTGMSLAPDGRLLATCDYKQINVWDVATGEMKRRFAMRGGLASLVRFYAKGSRLAVANHAGSGYGFDFLDAETGEQVARAALLERDAVESWDMAFADSGEPTILFLANETVYLCPWSVATGKGRGIQVPYGSPEP